MREISSPRATLSPRRFPTSAWFATLVALSVAFRLPALVNADTVNSDAAIVGLQARHILQGEWSWFLYGSGYQTSVDSCVAAAFFALFGATSRALVLSTLTGHVVATCLAFATLRRHVPTSAAFVAVLPLVFTSSPLHTYILNPPRQAALTLVFVAIFLLDGAGDRSSARLRMGLTAAGGAVASFAVFADPYALLLLPPLLVLGLLAALDGGADRRSMLRRAAATIAGALVGIVPFFLLLHSPRGAHGETTLTSAVLAHNWSLLRDPCLPWLLGTTAYVPRALLGYVAAPSGPIAHAVHRVGGVLFVLAVLSGGLAITWRRVPWGARRLGLFGAIVFVLTLASFLLSTMVMDLFSSRYLAALVLASPFALAPLAYRLRARGLALLLAPYLLGAGTAGWLGYGDEVSGARVVRLPGQGAEDERALEAMLLARGVHVAIADYWVSYRLTFLYDEAIAVIPIHAREDRYAPYRRAYAAAAKTAYIFDPQRSREDLAAMQAEAFSGATPWGRPGERLHAGALTAIVFDKPSDIAP
jgi:hypothetical protein